MKRLHVDFETRSEVNLQDVGAVKYAEHPSTEILCMAIAKGDHKPVVWSDDFESGPPGALQDMGDYRVVAHNSQFEDAIWHEILVKRFGWPALPNPENWECTLARAAACALPTSLDQAGQVLGTPFPKDMMGRANMLKLCRPRGYNPDGTPIWYTKEEFPEMYEMLYKYCLRDVESEQWLDRKLPPLNVHSVPSERAVWELDMTINRRGIKVDVPMAIAAQRIAGKVTNSLNAKLSKMTMGMVSKASRVKELREYLRYGCKVEGLEPTLMEKKKDRWVESKEVMIPLDETAKNFKWKEASLDKEAVVDLLAREDVSDHAKDVIHIRQVVAKSSTAKYKKIVDTASDRDHRVRGVLQFHAARTGRWGGRMLQPQNLPKGLPEAKQLQVIEALREGDDFFDLMYGDEGLDALKGAIRGAIVAGEGKTFCRADFNAIEARGLFWLAGEQEALDGYARGESPYVGMARFIYNDKKIFKPTADDQTYADEYDIGKRVILGCGYGMGWEKFIATVKKETGKIITEELAKLAVQSYRTKYHKVRKLWYATDAAAKNAIKNPGDTFYVAGGKIAYSMNKDRTFLLCRLPSGRVIRYFKPTVEKYVHEEYGVREEIRFWGLDSVTHQWVKLRTYGGSLVENYTQAIARDLMANGMLKCEAAGFPGVLTVHDELVSEIMKIMFAEDEATTLQRFCDVMCDTPTWAAGYPVVAEGWIGERYRK